MGCRVRPFFRSAIRILRPQNYSGNLDQVSFFRYVLNTAVHLSLYAYTEFRWKFIVLSKNGLVD
jgi:hypothetical protein